MTAQGFASFEDIGSGGEPDVDDGAAIEGEAADDDVPPLVYGSAEEFLHEQLLPSYIRKQARNARWCKRWYLHAEAISRVTAMWRSWEKLRLEAGTGASDWWLHHADPHMRVLLDPETGPFFNCDGEHRAPKTFVAEYAPSGWFPDERLDVTE